MNILHLGIHTECNDLDAGFTASSDLGDREQSDPHLIYWCRHCFHVATNNCST